MLYVNKHVENRNEGWCECIWLNMRHPGGGGGKAYCRIHRLSDHLNGLKGVSPELLAALLYLASWLSHLLSSVRDERSGQHGRWTLHNSSKTRKRSALCIRSDRRHAYTAEELEPLLKFLAGEILFWEVPGEVSLSWCHFVRRAGKDFVLQVK